MTPSSSLSAHQLGFFEHNGFLWLDAITTLDEVAELRVIYDGLFDSNAGRDEGSRYELGEHLPQLIEPSRYAPELQEMQYVANARAIAAQLFGDDLEPEFGEHMIYKPPRVGSETPWHQDQAYHDPGLRYRNVNFWLPLDDATVESGCMQFVPGSHRLAVVPHRHVGDDPNTDALEVDTDAFDRDAVACPIPAGGCTMHASYTLHYAGPNRSETPRRAYILVFRATAVPLDTPIDAYWQREPHVS